MMSLDMVSEQHGKPSELDVSVSSMGKAIRLQAEAVLTQVQGGLFRVPVALKPIVFQDVPYQHPPWAKFLGHPRIE